MRPTPATRETRKRHRSRHGQAGPFRGRAGRQRIRPSYGAELAQTFFLPNLTLGVRPGRSIVANRGLHVGHRNEFATRPAGIAARRALPGSGPRASPEPVRQGSTGRQRAGSKRDREQSIIGPRSRRRTDRAGAESRARRQHVVAVRGAGRGFASTRGQGCLGTAPSRGRRVSRPSPADHRRRRVRSSRRRCRPR